MVFLLIAITCLREASELYSVPQKILIAVAKAESGIRQVVSRNPNGTEDVCIFQINSVNFRKVGKVLRSLGVIKSPDVNINNESVKKILLSSPCACTVAGAFILSECYRKTRSWGKALVCYNGSRKYPARVLRFLLGGSQKTGDKNNLLR